MQVGLTEAGIVSYNGYTFDGAFRATISGRDVYDQSGRVVMYTEYTLDVHAIIADSTFGSDVEMAEIHQKLTHSGQELRIESKGFGNPVRAGGAFKRDVMFGPMPQVISWEPIGTTLACQIHWQCVFHLKECGQAVSNVRGALAVNYAIDVDIDEFGNTTRTISGHILFVNNRIGRAITETPESFLRAVNAVVPLGFKRRSRHHYNEAKNRVDFQLIDTEIGTHHNAFPEYMSDASARHRVSWGRQSGFKLRNSLSIRLTPRADISQTTCWLIALTMFEKRIAKQKAALSSDGKPGVVLLQSFSIEEDGFGRPVSCDFEWTHLHCLKKFIDDTGLFTPLVDNDWIKWRTSMANWSHNVRGNAKWQMLTSDDVVVDLCQGYQQQYIDINGDVASYPITTVAQKSFKNQKPTKEQSYIQYSQAIVPISQRQTIQHEILQTPDPASGHVDMLLSNLPNMGQPGGEKTMVQQSGRARHTVALVGHAKRAGHPIPKPKIDTVGGKTAVEIGGAFVSNLAYNLLGVPVYAARWAIQYALDDSPYEVKPKPNVQQKVDEDGTACSPDAS